MGDRFGVSVGQDFFDAGALILASGVVQVDGGYATHVLLPHPRYLIDYAPLPASLAATLMCSGLTAYAAFRR